MGGLNLQVRDPIHPQVMNTRDGRPKFPRMSTRIIPVCPPLASRPASKSHFLHLSSSTSHATITVRGEEPEPRNTGLVPRPNARCRDLTIQPPQTWEWVFLSVFWSAAIW